jgi:NAD(P)-dependent dehydrogenase (short-subunit alcohol dehydrogenase family)
MNFTKGHGEAAREAGHPRQRRRARPIWTPLQVSGGQTPEKLATFGADTPMGRPGQPAELAPVYVELASGNASYTTGQIYGVSGGRGNP